MGAGTWESHHAILNLMFRYTECVDQARLAKESKRHPTLSGPQASDGSAEYGVEVAGTWTKEIERTLENPTS